MHVVVAVSASSGHSQGEWGLTRRRLSPLEPTMCAIPESRKELIAGKLEASLERILKSFSLPEEAPVTAKKRNGREYI